jgi:hypothetical protein
MDAPVRSDRQRPRREERGEATPPHNGGGIPLELCAVADDGRACALECNMVAWGRTALSPEAGLAVYVRGDSGKLAAARVYDDSDPRLSAHASRPAAG